MNKKKVFFRSDILVVALKGALTKFHPRDQIRNPVMFSVFVGALLTTGLFGLSLTGLVSDGPRAFIGAITLWLWFTLIFSNFSEALAEGRGKAQALALKKTRSVVHGHKLSSPEWESVQTETISTSLQKGDLVLVEAGELIPADGEVLKGAASVDESAITGESAPVIRESGGDRSSVTGGTRVLSDRLIIRITQDPGRGFLDKMISLVEGAARQRTPNEVALSILLAALSLVFLVVSATLLPLSELSQILGGGGAALSVTALIALYVCLAPTTIGALLSTIGIAGMDRLSQFNVLASSGRAVEASGDVDILLLDKTGTITLGNRMASVFIPAQKTSQGALMEAAYYSSWADETPEGRSIIKLIKSQGLYPPVHEGHQHLFLPFSAQSRMSGMDWQGVEYRKGAVETMVSWIETKGGSFPQEILQASSQVSKQGATPLVITKDQEVLGLVVLKDTLKEGIQERFGALRTMGIKTIMITGDNPLTAASIAAEAGVDDFLAEATPEAKLALIRQYQAEGHLVAMTGDGTNDAPALAQADVAVAMNSGTQAAKEAGNMIDLDSNPTKLTDIVLVGKQMLITRGALTTFSVANDVAKYFAIIPALFLGLYPSLGVLNILQLNPETAILSAVVFNALIIPFLIPLALKGVPYKPQTALKLLQKNLLIYGVGGLAAPFLGIKIIDLILSWRIFG